MQIIISKNGKKVKYFFTQYTVKSKKILETYRYIYEECRKSGGIIQITADEESLKKILPCIEAFAKKAELTKQFDLPRGKTQFVYLLTKGGIYKAEFRPGVIPETEPEMRTVYVLYQRVLAELRNCQLKDEAEARKNR